MPTMAAAQCVQCFRSAAAQQAASMSAMNRGILILLLPVFALLGGFCWLAYRRRD
ncbi:MAG: hypothetical protein HYZ37_12610 [Candidatus Solibacter usitatus]|nr:hypothetical protein [Candidatus Solibacter usitatus]